MTNRLALGAATMLFLGILGLPHAEAGQITNREARQQGRIAEGIESGELTAREATRLERQQTRIEADRKKALADGNLSPQEKATLTREQNRASRHIYRQKHDAQKQPGAK